MPGDDGEGENRQGDESLGPCGTILLFLLALAKMLICGPIMWLLLMAGLVIIVVLAWPLLLLTVLYTLVCTPFLPPLRKLLGFFVVLLLAPLEPLLVVSVSAVGSLLGCIGLPFFDTFVSYYEGKIFVIYPVMCSSFDEQPSRSTTEAHRHWLVAGSLDRFLDVVAVLVLLVRGHGWALGELCRLAAGQKPGAGDSDSENSDGGQQPLQAQAQGAEEQPEAQPKDPPPCCNAIYGIVFGVLGLVLAGSACTLLLVVKLPFLIIVLFYEYTKMWIRALDHGCREGGCLPVVITLVLIPVGYVLLPLAIVLMVAVSWTVKVSLSAFWPAYVAAGWLWVVSRQGPSSACEGLCQAVEEGFKAIYQVIWGADLLTNSLLLRDFAATESALQDMNMIANGQRETLRPSSRSVSWLPAIRVGIFSGGDWELFAEVKEIPMHVLRQVWNSFFTQSAEVGRKAVEEGLIAAESFQNAEPHIFLGLPAVIVYRALCRSPAGEEAVELASGHLIRMEHVPEDEQVKTVWKDLLTAKKSLEAAQLSPEETQSMEVLLLLGDAADDDLTPLAKEKLQEVDKRPPDRQRAMRQVVADVKRVAIAVTKLERFKLRINEVLEDVGTYKPGTSSSWSCRCCSGCGASSSDESE